MTDEHEIPANEESLSTEATAAENGGEASSSDQETPAAPAEAVATEHVETTGEAAPEAAEEQPPEAPAEESAGEKDEESTASAAESDEGSEPKAEAADPEPAKVKAPPAPAPLVKPERPEIVNLRKMQEAAETVEGKVIGWNNGGLHVVVDGVTAFCPRSEIELGAPRGLEAYLDKVLPFKVLRVQKRGRRVVLSRRSILQGDRNLKLSDLREAMREGTILDGKVSSVTDFGAFVDVGGIDGLVHISELSRSRVEHASEMVSEGDEVQVRVLKVSDDGTRVSLSMKALEPDPWDGIEDQFPAGSVVKGTVEKIANFGAFVEIAPGLTGLLPTSAMNLPRNAQPARIYHPGKEISVQILSIDRRRRRISLALEGSQVEGTRADLKSFQEKQGTTGDGFGALAAAFKKARKQD